MGGLGLKSGFHFGQNIVKVLQIDLAVETVQNLDKAAHVSALELVGQINIHVDRGHGLLGSLFFIQNGDRVGYIFYPDLFDVDFWKSGWFWMSFISTKVPFDRCL